MKFRTTRKEILKNGGEILSIGYCDACHLLRYHDPEAYTCGIYGWNFDVYFIYGVTICTGDRNMLGKRPERLQEFEKKAKEIVNDYSIKYDEARETVEILLKEFCKINGGY